MALDHDLVHQGFREGQQQLSSSVVPFLQEW